MPGRKLPKSKPKLSKLALSLAEAYKANRSFVRRKSAELGKIAARKRARNAPNPQ
jgi:hypothetical protein